MAALTPSSAVSRRKIPDREKTAPGETARRQTKWQQYQNRSRPRTKPGQALSRPKVPRARTDRSVSSVAVDTAAAASGRRKSDRRLLSLVYETLLLAAVLFAATLPVLILMQHAEQRSSGPCCNLCSPVMRRLFVWQWLHGARRCR